MRSILKRPAVNALCLGIFSAFYACVFIYTAQSDGFISRLSPAIGVTSTLWR